MNVDRSFAGGRGCERDNLVARWTMPQGVTGGRVSPWAEHAHVTRARYTWVFSCVVLFCMVCLSSVMHQPSALDPDSVQDV